MSDYLKSRQQHIFDGRPLPQKKQYKIPAKSKKRSEKEAKEKAERGDNPTELQAWYKRCVKLLSGYCTETGLKTETKIFQYAIMSVCHILPKASCKSVATHPCNWLELNVDFHKKFDAMSWEEREQLGCWPEIRDRLVHVYQDLAEDEKRHFPESVLKYMEENNPFPGQ